MIHVPSNPVEDEDESDLLLSFAQLNNTNEIVNNKIKFLIIISQKKVKKFLLLSEAPNPAFYIFSLFLGVKAPTVFR